MWDQRRKDYFAYVCTNGKCPRYGAEWRNQDDDPKCQWCREERRRIGHFEVQRDYQRRRDLETGRMILYRPESGSGSMAGMTGVSRGETIGTRSASGDVIG